MGSQARAPFRLLDRFLDSLIVRGDVSALSAVVVRDRETLLRRTAGFADSARKERLEERHQFDLASLSKPFTATLALALDRRGELALSQRVAGIVPELERVAGAVRLGDLLRHRARLAPWYPLCRLPGSPRQALIELLTRPELWRARLGTYSDLGYILWGVAAERQLGQSLEELLRLRVSEPLGIPEIGGSVPEERAVVSSLDNGKEVELACALGLRVSPRPGPDRGTVQDGNARSLGGFAGHAGLFGTADDVLRLAEEWASPDRVLDLRTRDRALAGSGPFALGWARRARRGSAGPALAVGAFGHTGFTGSSLWIEPDRGWILILLAARTSPFSDANRWRRRFHTLCARALSSGSGLGRSW